MNETGKTAFLEVDPKRNSLHRQPGVRATQEQEDSTDGTIGLTIRVLGEGGAFKTGTRFELLFNGQLIASAGTMVDGTLLFPVGLGETRGLGLRMAADQHLARELSVGPSGPEVHRWSDQLDVG